MKKLLISAVIIAVAAISFVENKSNSVKNIVRNNVEAIADDLVLDFDYWKDYEQFEVREEDPDGKDYEYVDVIMLGYNPSFDLCFEKARCNWKIYQHCFKHK